MYSLKEGSRFEDFALMEALSEIIQTVNKSTGMRLVQLNFFVFQFLLGSSELADWLDKRLELVESWFQFFHMLLFLCPGLTASIVQ